MNFYIVDCFAEGKYQGNQLAVFLPDGPVSDGEMQRIANEIGFSETTFILSGRRDNGGYDVRIFTPDVEVPFAGHPTLGTAHIIHTVLEGERTDRVQLNLKAGQIPVSIDARGIVMTQNEPVFGEILDKRLLAGVLSIEDGDIRDDYPVQWVSTGLEAIIVPLRSVDALRRCHVNHDRFHAFIRDHYKCNIMAFVPEGDGIRDRVFMDDPGFLEDPATGSANGDLAAYLLRHDFFGSSDLRYTVSQGSEMGRPSKLEVTASLREGRYTIEVGGHACTVARGEWLDSSGFVG